jgi:hypothetical protein
MMGFPSQVTLLLPLDVSCDIAMFGYGIGIGELGGAGVKQTSGMKETVPPLSL